MRSRTVRPIKRRNQKSKGRSSGSLGDTQPMYPVSDRGAGSSMSDTRPMRPVNGASGYRNAGYGRSDSPHPGYGEYGASGSRGTGYARAGYEGYQRSVERRRKTVQTPRRPQPRTARPARAKRSALASLIIRLRRKPAAKEQYFDYDMLLVIVFLMCFGLVMLYSTSAYEAQTDFGNDLYYFTRQALIGAVGFVVMLIVSRIDYHLYGAFAVEIFVVSMILMALVQTPLGVTINGARRWIGLPGGQTLQPAEITKIAVILFISYELCRLGKKAYTKEGMLRVFVLGVIAALGVYVLTDNLSTAIIVMSITCILIFVIHPQTKPFLIGIAALAAFAIVGIGALSIIAANSDNFRIQRILSWLNPEATAADGSFQVMQGLYAIGSGGFFGKGLGNSTQKLGVIPEAQNDMILVVICEELGVFGAILILVLFGLLLYRLMFIAKNAPDLYGSLIATGIFAHIALQVILNIAVVTGLLPTTGITLPFISYGGTAILFLMIEMGIALGISRRIRLEGE